MAKKGEIKFGDYVETTPYGYKGRVFEVFETFDSTGAGLAWFNMQTIKRPVSALKERWFSILCVDDGAVLVPESAARVVAKMDINHPSYSKYFKD